MNYFLGLDIGTSGAKCALIDEQGRFVSAAGREYPILTPRAGWAEQNPEEWVAAAAATVRQALRESEVEARQVAGIGLAGQMHSLVCLGAGGEALRPAILWADTRSAAQVERLTREIGRERLAEWAGNPLAAGFMLASWAWLRENELETVRRTRALCLPKDYVRLRLTGRLGSEPSDASSTLLFDPHARDWSAPLLAVAGVSPEQMPRLHPSAEMAGGLLPGFAAACGLAAGTPVVYGGSDQACQALAQGALRPGRVTVTIGTGGQVLAPCDRPAHDPELRLHLFCHVAPAAWHLEAATLSAGLALRWLRDAIAPGHGYAELANAAAQVEAARDGLFFAPYLAGERTPHMDPRARAAFIGLGLGHGAAHLTRAVMEGVVFALREGFELMLALGAPAEQVVASGGATRHPLWLQLLADTLHRPVAPGLTPEATATGAALLAGVGAGAWQDAAQAAGTALQGEMVWPDPERSAMMERGYRTYQEIYPALRKIDPS